MSHWNGESSRHALRLAALGALLASSVPAQRAELDSFEPLLFSELADPKKPGLDVFREQLRMRA